MGKRSIRFWTVMLVGLVAIGGVVAGVVLSSSGSTRERDQDPAWAGGHEVPNALHEAASEAHQAKFERNHGKEADRGGPSSPAAEQVGDRAYPRSYVDDRLAVAARRAFQKLPTRASNPAAGRVPHAVTAFQQNWSELGPFTPNVSAPSSQFFDPATLTGPTSQESGRVTALAIDPACAPGNCRLWVAAAGGGIWRTDDALAAHVTWIAPPDDLPTDAFGSLYYDAAHDTLYAGSGEPNGSGDSEAGLGLFKSTDDGASWTLVPGSAAVATNRSIGAIAVDPTDPNTIYIGTDVARHGSSAVNGGRFTPPDAPALGVYRSTDGGQTFALESDLSAKTPPNPSAASSGSDWFQGGINKLELDPNDHNQLYAAVFGYGIWRADQSVDSPSWGQVFHTMNQNDFSRRHVPKGDSTGDRTEFDLVDTGVHTRMYVGDASDDWVLDGDASTPLPQAWRSDAVDSITPDPTGNYDNSDFVQLSSDDPSQPGFDVYGFCQNGQCGYDEFVAHPPGADDNTVWYGGSMNYDELPAYDQFGTGAPPRSNGRAVIRSTNADGTADTTTWDDMTAVLNDPTSAWGVKSGIHPDLHAIAFAQGGNIAFIGSDGGVVRIDTQSPQDESASCDARTWDYDSTDPTADPTPLQADDLARCKDLLSGVPTSITPINDGLRTLQFQSVSIDPANPVGDLLGGTQDNGTWAYTGGPAWSETVGGDGGQSGFDHSNPTSVRYHNYYDATPEVNFHGDDPTKWLDIYDPLQVTDEARSFYTPFIADPTVGGRAFTGLEHVWRTDDNGGDENQLANNGCYAYDLDPFRSAPCGDWVPIGQNLTATKRFGGSRAGQYVVAVERARTDDNTMWAATRTGRVFITKNAGAAPNQVTFVRLDTNATPDRFVSGIAIDPADANHAVVSYSGYGAYTPATPGHVYDVRYDPTTQKATWTDVSLNLPDQPVTGITVDATGDVFAATDFGVVGIAPGSTTWVRAGTNLPMVSVFGLSVTPNGRRLYAATHGRGVWALNVPSAPTGPRGNPTGSINGPTTITAGTPATFTATGATPNGGNVTFAWALPGSPATGSGSSVTFTAATPGPRVIVLTISDSAGASTTVSKPVTVTAAPSSAKPTISVKPVKTVALHHATTVRGSITAPAGAKTVTLTFGDGRTITVRLQANGSFTVHHRYRKAKRYALKISVTDNAGRTVSQGFHARVRKPIRHAGRHKKH